MDAEIICVGTELLMGQVVNTNGRYLGQKLNELGINHYFQTVVGDNASRLQACISLAEGRSDLIILTGGLGPTPDDQTKESLAAYLDLELMIDPESLASIEEDFKQANRSMQPNNKKMALYFKEGWAFQNKVGQAIGTAVEKNNSLYVVLPGPPRELQPMFEHEMKPFLIERIQEKLFIDSRYLNYYGIGESDVASRLNDLLAHQSNPTLAIYSTGQTIIVRLTVQGYQQENNQRILNEWTDRINQIIGPWYFGQGMGLTPARALVEKLKKQRLTLALAESLTGGGGASQLVEIEGASQVFRGGVVAYDPEAKIQVLGVDSQIIDQHGMVSRPCAQAMANQAREKFQSDIAISWTGVAGPDPMEGHEAGRVFVGFSLEGHESHVQDLDLVGDRNTIRQRAINWAFIHLLKSELFFDN